MKDLSHREKKLILVFSIILLIFIGLFFGREYRAKSDSSVSQFEMDDTNSILDVSDVDVEDDREQVIFIHISGAVNRSGLLELSSDSRLVDAIEQAGGAKENADLDKVNLSRKLRDEERIHIPEIGETLESMSLINQEYSESKEDKININTCDKSLLTELPGIGDKTAEKIINFREKTPFQTIEDLKEVPGIGEKKFEDLKDQICI